MEKDRGTSLFVQILPRVLKHIDWKNLKEEDFQEINNNPNEFSKKLQKIMTEKREAVLSNDAELMRV